MNSLVLGPYQLKDDETKGTKYSKLKEFSLSYSFTIFLNKLLICFAAYLTSGSESLKSFNKTLNISTK